MSRADKATTRVVYEIEIDHATKMPVGIDMIVTTQIRPEEGKASNGQHLAFKFDYTLGKFNEIKRFDVPRDAAKLLK